MTLAVNGSSADHTERLAKTDGAAKPDTVKTAGTA